MNTRDRWLASVGLACLAIYVLACGPAFSPDGSKILVTASGGTNHQGHLLVYDLKSAKWNPLLTIAQSPRGNAALIPAGLWSADGKEVVAAWASDDHQINVSVLPVDGREPTRFFQLDGLEEALSNLMVPPVLVVLPRSSARFLLFGGESITALNLESGETEERTLAGNAATNALKSAVYLAGQGREVFYLMGVGQATEVGRLDLESLEPKALFRFESPKEDGNPSLAISRVGSRMALTAGDADNQSLRVYRRSQLERTLPFGATNNGIVLGNLVWSLDGNTIYATGFRPLKPGLAIKAMRAGYDALRAAGFRTTTPTVLDLQVSVCEIPLDGQPFRETPLFRIAGAHADTYQLFYRIALSPDGRTIAASAGLSEAEDTTREQDRALFLMDLSRSGRPVSRIPIPRAAVVPTGLK